MVGNFKRFDFGKKPKRQSIFLRPVMWLACAFFWMKKHPKIDKSGMPKNKNKIKPPYFILCNHNAFLDFIVLSKAIFPRRANYVVAIDGFLIGEWLLRAIGCVGVRKFTRGVSIVKNMLKAKDNGDIVALWPEARYSLCGTQSAVPNSLAKIIRKMNVPVVLFMCHGHHVNSPFWHVGDRGVAPVKSEMFQLFSQEETQTLSAEEIMARIREKLVYDDFRWQKEHGIKIKGKKRAEGLHSVLYQCPHCNTEYKMSSSGIHLKCGSCGKTWEMTELGELKALSGETEFSHIPDWYEWERANVRSEIENRTYRFESEVRIESLPAPRWHKLGKGRLIHDMDGFVLTGTYKKEPFEVKWNVPSLYSCHIEYNYKGRGDCVDLSTLEDSFYTYPLCDEFSVTKLSLATEELYRHKTGRVG